MTQFTTRLHKSFDLTGEWEVGMSEILFPHSWYNVTRNNCYFSMHCMGGLKTDNNSLEAKDYYLRIEIRSGYYESMEAIVNTLNNAIEKTFKNPIEAVLDPSLRVMVNRSEWPKFSYNSSSMKIFTTLPAMTHMIFGGKLADILGLGVSQNPMHNHNSEALTITSTRVCDLEGGLHAVYVYCDLPESVPVGDTLAPLMGIVASEGRIGKTIKTSFYKPRYIPLQKKSFDSVEIFIRDAYGIPIAFENGRSTVTLHFRRVKVP